MRDQVLTVREQLLRLKEEALAAIAGAGSLSVLQEMRVRYLGKKSDLNQVLSGLGRIEAMAERKAVGALGNEIKEALSAALDAAVERLGDLELERRLQEETLDVTLPGSAVSRGHLHLLTQTRHRIEEVFIAMGYEVAQGPEVETDWYNFEALNIPKGHPARDAQDSFFLSDSEEVLLRTHTSNAQVRYMLEVAKGRLPVRIICPGRVYRNDFEDATHSHMFHQVEGLCVDSGITLGDLKGTLLEMARALFGPETAVRLRPSYFPFTEPSAEMDISCIFCRQQGCRVCKQTGWIEIGGSGMVHPVVLRNGGYDPEVVSGWAFGYGIERIAMLVYGIEDMRNFYNNDMRFVRQF
jgi:phenylalanyl-tRNA synthetase alpha chain